MTIIKSKDFGESNSYAIFREQNFLKSSDDGVEETLLSIPNRKVKLYSVDGTAWVTVWESRTLPGNMDL